MSDEARGALISLVAETSRPGVLKAGDVIAERHRVVRFVARGGMGTVYEAAAPDGARVAIKTVAPDADDDELRLRFEREAQAMSRLTHPGIVGVQSFGRLADGAYYMVMDFVPGATLTQLFKARQITAASAAGAMRQAILALGYAHAMGVVHRDLKPDNVMVLPGGSARVLDFGIAKLIDDASGGKLTRQGAVYGTPHYVSPEQTMGRPVDGRADLYAAGVILYEALTGRVPFRATEVPAILRMHAAVPPPTLEATAGRPFAPEVQAFISKALAKRPDDRFADARTMVQALDAVHALL